MPSFPKVEDEEFLAALRDMKTAGARVAVTTTQSPEGVVTRIVTVTWDTHNPGAGAL